MKGSKFISLIFLTIFLSCNQVSNTNISESKTENISEYKQYITILGIAQDAGYPQIDCEKACCKAIYEFGESKKW